MKKLIYLLLLTLILPYQTHPINTNQKYGLPTSTKKTAIQKLAFNKKTYKKKRSPRTRYFLLTTGLVTTGVVAGYLYYKAYLPKPTQPQIPNLLEDSDLPKPTQPQIPNLLENSEFIKSRRSLDKLQKKDISSDLTLIKELAEVIAPIIYPEEQNITDTQKHHTYQILINLEALLALHQAKNKNAAIQKLNTFTHDYIWQLITATDRILLPEDFKWLLIEPLTTALATHYKNGMKDADVKEFIETIQNFYRLNTSILLPPYKKHTLQHDDSVNSAQFSTASLYSTAQIWELNDTLEVTPAERILYEAFKKSGLTTFNNVINTSYTTKIIKQLYKALKKSGLTIFNNITDTSYANTIIKRLNARVEKLNPKIKPLIPVQEQ